MHLTVYVLTALSAFLGLSQAQTGNAGYDSVCSPPLPAGQEDKVDVGLYATYQCDIINVLGGYLQQDIAAPTPADCARRCGERTDNAQCSWHGDKCYFYSPGTSIAYEAQAVKVIIRKDWDKLKDAYDQCQADLASCQADLTTCQADLAACQAASGGSGAGGGTGAGAGGTPLDCNSGGTDTTFNAHGHQWELKCGWMIVGPLTRPLNRRSKASSLDACVQICANEGSQCMTAEFNSQNGDCLRWHIVNTSSTGGKSRAYNRFRKLS